MAELNGIGGDREGYKRIQDYMRYLMIGRRRERRRGFDRVGRKGLEYLIWVRDRRGLQKGYRIRRNQGTGPWVGV